MVLFAIECNIEIEKIVIFLTPVTPHIENLGALLQLII